MQRVERGVEGAGVPEVGVRVPRAGDVGHEVRLVFGRDATLVRELVRGRERQL